MTPSDIRTACARAFSPQREPGYVCFNTHHEVYEARVSVSSWVVMPAHLVEMNDAQLETWLGRLKAVRGLAWGLVNDTEQAA